MTLNELPYEPRKLATDERHSYLQWANGKGISPNVDKITPHFINPVVIEMGAAPQVTEYAIIAERL